MNNKAFRAYQATSVTTAKPEKVLLLLYEGCIKFIRAAKTKMIEKKVAEKGKNISKSLAILSELVNTLDHDIGGQLSRDLESLYMFMIDRVIESNIKNTPEELDVVEKLLMTLYEAWNDVINNPRPDGVPSKSLQPELYEMYVKQGKPIETESVISKKEGVGVAVNLSAELKTNFMSKKQL